MLKSIRAKVIAMLAVDGLFGWVARGVNHGTQPSRVRRWRHG
jgi:hypothetical protein